MTTITGGRLKALREQRGLSQEDMANRLGVNRSTYVKYENGINKPVRKLKELAEFFGVTTDYIMGVSDKKIESTESNTVVLTPAQKEILRLYDMLDSQDKERAWGVFTGMLMNDKYKKEA